MNPDKEMLLVMDLTLQPEIIWKDVRYDLPENQSDKAETFEKP